MFAYSFNNHQKNKVVPVKNGETYSRLISLYLPSIIPQELQCKSFFSLLKLRLASDNIYILILKLKWNISFDNIILLSSLFGRLLIFIFVDIIIGKFVYIDNGICDGIVKQLDCTNYNYLIRADRCKWDINTTEIIRREFCKLICILIMR